MRVAIIGRSEMLYDTATHLHNIGYEIALIVSSKEALEYKKKVVDFELLAQNLGVAFIETAHITKILPILNSQKKIDIAVSVKKPSERMAFFM